MTGVVTSKPHRVMSAVVAAERAGITYRQLDHWERRGWVTASIVDTVGAGRRVRRYQTADVVRLAALRHLARSGFDVADIGVDIGTLILGVDDLLVVNDTDRTITTIRRNDLVNVVTSEGRWAVFDPAPIYTACATDDSPDRVVVDASEHWRAG